MDMENAALYTVEIKLKNNEMNLDSKKLKIGLRTIKLTGKRMSGESFEFVVNGKDIFAMGLTIFQKIVYCQ